MELYLFALLAGFCAVQISSAVELTFELPDNEKQCFYEDIKAGEKTSVEFQVSATVLKCMFVWTWQLSEKLGVT